MGQNESVIALVVLALIAANAPFISQRLFGVLALARGKTLWIRLLELIVLYFMVGAAGLLLEHRLGQIAAQKWEFYAITATAFITFAFPGFVWRYLLKLR